MVDAVLHVTAAIGRLWSQGREKAVGRRNQHHEELQASVQQLRALVHSLRAEPSNATKDSEAQLNGLQDQPPKPCNTPGAIKVSDKRSSADITLAAEEAPGQQVQKRPRLSQQQQAAPLPLACNQDCSVQQPPCLSPAAAATPPSLTPNDAEAHTAVVHAIPCTDVQSPPGDLVAPSENAPVTTITDLVEQATLIPPPSVTAAPMVESAHRIPSTPAAPQYVTPIPLSLPLQHGMDATASVHKPATVAKPTPSPKTTPRLQGDTHMNGLQPAPSPHGVAPMAISPQPHPPQPQDVYQHQPMIEQLVIAATPSPMVQLSNTQPPTSTTQPTQPTQPQAPAPAPSGPDNSPSPADPAAVTVTNGLPHQQPSNPDSPHVQQQPSPSTVAVPQLILDNDNDDDVHMDTAGPTSPSSNSLTPRSSEPQAHEVLLDMNPPAATQATPTSHVPSPLTTAAAITPKSLVATRTAEWQRLAAAHTPAHPAHAHEPVQGPELQLQQQPAAAAVTHPVPSPEHTQTTIPNSVAPCSEVKAPPSTTKSRGIPSSVLQPMDTSSARAAPTNNLVASVRSFLPSTKPSVPVRLALATQKAAPTATQLTSVSHDAASGVAAGSKGTNPTNGSVKAKVALFQTFKSHNDTTATAASSAALSTAAAVKKALDADPVNKGTSSLSKPRSLVPTAAVKQPSGKVEPQPAGKRDVPATAAPAQPAAPNGDGVQRSKAKGPVTSTEPWSRNKKPVPALGSGATKTMTNTQVAAPSMQQPLKKPVVVGPSDTGRRPLTVTTNTNTRPLGTPRGHGNASASTAAEASVPPSPAVSMHMQAGAHAHHQLRLGATQMTPLAQAGGGAGAGAGPSATPATSSRHHLRTPAAADNRTKNAAGTQAVGQSELLNYSITPWRQSGGDSEDDNGSPAPGPKKAIPSWALAVNILPGLLSQSNIDPDTVFGRPSTFVLADVFAGMPPLDPAKASKHKRSNYHKRSSSGNWTADRVTWQEELRYKRAMGFLQSGQ